MHLPSESLKYPPHILSMVQSKLSCLHSTFHRDLITRKKLFNHWVCCQAKKMCLRENINKISKKKRHIFFLFTANLYTCHMHVSKIMIFFLYIIWHGTCYTFFPNTTLTCYVEFPLIFFSLRNNLVKFYKWEITFIHKNLSFPTSSLSNLL